MLCPQCGELTHRSHTRGLGEKVVKALTSHKTYRCHDCGWRGWLRTGGDPVKRRQALRTIISVLVTLLITTLLALYVVEKLSPATPNVDFEQPQTR